MTIGGLLEGKKIDCPPSRHGNVTFKKAPKAADQDVKAVSLPLGEDP